MVPTQQDGIDGAYQDFLKKVGLKPKPEPSKATTGSHWTVQDYVEEIVRINAVIQMIGR